MIKSVYLYGAVMLVTGFVTQVFPAPCIGNFDIYEAGDDSLTWEQMTVKQTSWNYAHFLILRSEISTCDPSTVTAIAFYRTRRDDCETIWDKTEVFLRKTTATSLTANEDPPPAGATNVYSDTWKQTLVGWQPLTFVRDFIWDSDNLEIWVKEDNADTGCCSPYYSTTLIGYMQEGYGNSGYYIESTRRFDIRIIFAGGSPVPTPTPRFTSTNTPTVTPTNEVTDTPTGTPTLIPTNTPTNTPAITPTNTFTSTSTAIPTDTPSVRPSNTATPLPSNTPSSTFTQPPIPMYGSPGISIVFLLATVILGIAGSKTGKR